MQRQKQRFLFVNIESVKFAQIQPANFFSSSFFHNNICISLVLFNMSILVFSSSANLLSYRVTSISVLSFFWKSTHIMLRTSCVTMLSFPLKTNTES
jgi:hypothetical protein